MSMMLFTVLNIRVSLNRSTSKKPILYVTRFFQNPSKAGENVKILTSKRFCSESEDFPGNYVLIWVPVSSTVHKYFTPWICSPSGTKHENAWYIATFPEAVWGSFPQHNLSVYKLSPLALLFQVCSFLWVQ